ncbi:hypothetical protein SLEP1_g52379 [Rubroshorea leprosula]|uniref:Uncharacterized protein n=1 Tax=Rubroshorea leprosula TaxID=152421 RepID=A0AAV5M681_9ROSI|nr:hypothetical protein SLEP1_g52379 [Rubroshorea leprosula]
MMETQATPPPMPPLRPLYKQMSWSLDVEREEAWLRRKGNHKKGLKRSKSVTVWAASQSNTVEVLSCFYT